jgi:dinuclear metal center YbgI/SA1388 family protein
MSIIADIVRRLHQFAPPGLAESWDNVGLQLGDPRREFARVLITLDATPAAIHYAATEGFDLIVAHHPLIFKPLSSITDPLLLDLAVKGIAVLSAHTNLDSIRDGVSAALADRLGLGNRSILAPAGEWLHVAVYTPEEAVEAVSEAAFNAGAGWIGNYRECMNRTPVLGQFRGTEGSRPAIGSPGKLEVVDEAKLEFFCEAARLNDVLAAVRAAHPYETPACAVYPQKLPSPNVGMGVIGELTEAMPLNAFADFVKERLGAPFVRVWNGAGTAETPVKRIAVCGGSGGSFAARIQNRADVYVTGDVTYHTCLDSRIALIDAGHFHTEYPVLETLRKVLDQGDAEYRILPLELHEISRLGVR